MSWFKNSKWYDGYDEDSREVFNSVDKAVLDKFECFQELVDYLPKELLHLPMKITVKTAIKIILYKHVYGEWPTYDYLCSIKPIITRDDLSWNSYKFKMTLEGKL